MLEKFEVGTTKFCVHGVPENEQRLFEAAMDIADRHDPANGFTANEQHILTLVNQRFWMRICDLFTSYLEGILCHDDTTARMVLHERVVWFLKELRKEIDQQLEVSEIERNTPEDSEVDEVDEYFRKAPELYTPESYDELQTSLFLDLLKNPKFKKKIDEALKRAKEKVEA